MRRFAFYGRVSTEDQQDPEASRNWQLSRAQALVEGHGEIVSEFFDIGHSRSIPWKRRPEASRLLDALKQGDRGFDAVVIGEPQRAFYGYQYGLTFPVFVHYGVELWVPEVGGAIDPESEAHDLVMSVFGGMSKGERNRIKIRVRAAMAAQAKVEGRFLGGRPPYGYQLADAGPHPNPAKAADGKRLRRLEPDPVTAPIVGRIFQEYQSGRGLFSIAEELTRDGIPSPAAHDRARNRHRCGLAWSMGAVRTILSNPRYTGRQVWNKQRKDEVLIDVDDVALGHMTRLRWNDEADRVWSTDVVHEALIDTATFDTVQAMLKAKGAGRYTRERHRVRRPYALRGLVHCGVCERRMQGQWSHERPYYRCRFSNEYGLANKVEHPRNVYLAEDDVLPPVDEWLTELFAPHRVDDTIAAMMRSQPDVDTDPAIVAAARMVEECDAKLARYRAALEAGTDPTIVAAWTAEVQACKAEALSRSRQAEGRRRMSAQEIEGLVEALGNIRTVIADAEPADKAEVYGHLGLKLTYNPGKRTMGAEIALDARSWGYGRCPEGSLRGSGPVTPR
ncbi:MAG: recombinase family protein [Haloechinothrix sp.]